MFCKVLGELDTIVTLYEISAIYCYFYMHSSLKMTAHQFDCMLYSQIMPAGQEAVLEHANIIIRRLIELISYPHMMVTVFPLEINLFCSWDVPWET